MSPADELGTRSDAASRARPRRSPDYNALPAEAPRARTIAFATWLVLVVYAFPGYMSFDADAQLSQARAGKLGDWHPPAMGAYWHVVETFVRGPFPLLVLQSALFVFGLSRLLRRYLDAVTAAWLTAVIVLLPPIFAPMAVIWKDAQMAALLTAGVALAVEPKRWQRALGVGLLCAAAAVRDNALLALPPLCLWIASVWLGRGRWRVLAAAIGLTIAIGGAARLIDRAVTHQRDYPWYRSVAIHDIAGTLCNDASIDDAEIARLIAPTGVRATKLDRATLCAGYSPRVWFGLVFDAGSIWKAEPSKPERIARLATWRELVHDHPRAYAAHRWHVFREVLGLTDAQPWEPVCQTVNANDDFARGLHHDSSLSWFQQRVGGALRAIATTIVFRPWLYALLALALLGYALVKRLGVVAALAGSGLCFELGYFAAASAPDFRYSHWLITCVALGIALAFAARRQARYLAGG